METEGSAKYDELVEQWKKDTKITVDQKVWEKFSLDALKVNSITPATNTESTETEGTEGTETEATEGTETEATEGTETEATTETTAE